jgi:fermentation-respiration switch protein FrsA (DUF1100 family)
MDRAMRARIGRFILNRLIIIAVAVAIVLVLGRIFENRLIFFPPRYPTGFSRPEDFGLHLEEVWLTASDGVKLNGWFLANPASPKVLLWFHGNAENIGMGLEQMREFAALGTNIFELDYRGYGKSEGSPDEQGVYRDADAAYRYLGEIRRFKPADIFIYGHSIGGAVAVDLASRQSSGGLVVESSLSSAKDVIRHVLHLPYAELAFKSKFDSVSKIKNVRAPVMVIHGKKDQVLPFAMGEKLYAAAPQPKTFYAYDGAGHDDSFLVGGAVYFDRLRTFMGLPPAPARARPGVSAAGNQP